MRIAATTLSVSVLALAVVATAGARTLGLAEAGRPVTIYRTEPLAQAYRPVRDAYLSMILGLGVNVFSPSLDHRASGYADPNAPRRSVDLSVQTYDGIAALRFFGNQGLVTPLMARSAYVLAHELGHLNARDHGSEDEANAWAAVHFQQVLVSLGLSPAACRAVVRLARRELLV
jgi:hypothetical protein